jgi:aryl-alcohol dehydrogenase-like predicted oxidoreductase
MAIMTRPLGRTQADVTILGYGAMELRGLPRGPEIADEDAGRLLNAVLDGGINLIDTSPADAGIPAMEFVLRFTLSHPGLSTTIVGTANPGHLAGNIAIAQKGPLPADLYEEAKKLLPQ